MRELPVLTEHAATASSKLVDCNGCMVCCERGGIVYLQDEEVENLARIGVPMVTLDGVSFIKRLSDGSCPMLDRNEKKCSIYENRPLCCRLFPLDVLSINGKLQWAVANQCPDERKFFGAWQGPGSRLGSGSVSRIASAIDVLLSPNDFEYLERKEKISARVQLLEEDRNSNWTAVAPCIKKEAQPSKKSTVKKKKESKKAELKRKLKEKKKKNKGKKRDA